MNFVERTTAGLLAAVEHAFEAETLAHRDGLLQGLDPRAKVIGLLALVVAVALAQRLEIIGGLFAVALALAVLSRVPLRRLMRGWLGVLAFTGPIAVPAIFTTPGLVVTQLPGLGWAVTAQGLRSATLLVSRVETAATFSLLLVLCTPWTHVLKALRVLRVPVVFVVILGMTHRYIFLLIQIAHDLLEARRSRLVGRLPPAQRRRLAASTAGVLLTKSMHLSDEVYLAMLARGFRGEVYTLDDFVMRRHDWAALLGFAGLAALAVWMGG